jgi:multicomponent Na+:H+ antiporter subunit B
VGVGCAGVLFVLAVLRMPHFGTTSHPYRDHAVSSAVQHKTANVVSAVNYDQRSLDTLIEETILFGSVMGAAALLRPSKEERERKDADADQGRTLEATRLAGYVLLPVTLVVGLDVVVHGHLTPGGGFQGGVVLATGLHFLYTAGQYRTLEKLRSTTVFEVGEAVGEAAYVCLGLAAIATVGAFLGNMIGQGSFGELFSSGTVPLLSIAVGIEVASGVVIVLAAFLEQALAIGPEPHISQRR